MKSIMIISALILSSTVFAKPKSDLDTNFKFNGLKVKGRYNVPSESLIKVEDDKSINDLIYMRRHFRDRIKESLQHK